MATVRIRTLDPDAVSFFTAKLADCGFDIEFAAPGQKVRGEVDLEITVNYTRKSTAARKQARAVGSKTSIQQNVTWTTPYHAEAPELAVELTNTRAEHQNASADRDLARIIAGGSKRGEMFVFGIRDEEDSAATLQKSEPPTVPTPAPQLAIVTPSPKLAAAPNNSPAPPKRRPVPRHSFLQRHAAFATAFILPAAVIIFYLSLFGNPTSTSQPEHLISQAPTAPTVQPASFVTPPSQSPVPTAEVLPEIAPASTPESYEASTLTPIHSRTHHKSSRHPAPRTRRPSAPEPDQEVTVHHFTAD